MSDQLDCEHDFEPNTTMNFFRCDKCGIRSNVFEKITILKQELKRAQETENKTAGLPHTAFNEPKINKVIKIARDSIKNRKIDLTLENSDG